MKLRMSVVALAVLSSMTAGSVSVHGQEAPAEAAANDGWTTLFNGEDLTGWTAVTPPAAKRQSETSWTTDPERAVLRSSSSSFVWLESTEKLEDFDLRFEWRFVPGGKVSGNGGGVVVRSAGVHSRNLDPRGVEVKLLPGEKAGGFMVFGTPLTAGKTEAKGEAPLFIPPATVAELKPNGSWNQCHIRCEGDAIKVALNGVKVNEATGARSLSGPICLRSQGSEVEFRKIEFKLRGE